MADGRERRPNGDRAAAPRVSPFVIALGIYALAMLAYYATMSRERLVHHTEYNHYALLADAWLHGRLDLGGPPPAYTGNNDFAVFEGRTYVSFPPFPAVLIAPVVWVMGGAAHVRDGLFFLAFAGLAPAILFLALDKLRRTGRSLRTVEENLGLALLFAFGTVYWFSAVQGTVWFATHVVATACAALYAYAAIDAEYPVVAGLALGLGLATRPEIGFAFPLFVREALKQRERGLSRIAAFGVPPAAILALLMWHNEARFDDAFEFGHHLLAIGWRGRIDQWGLFSYHYLGRNLAVVLTGLPFFGTANAPFVINSHGLALWITSPFYVFALWPRRPTALYWSLAATAFTVALPSLLYQNTGWLQFGYRFSNDFAPFLVMMIAVSRRPLRTSFWMLGAFALLVNAFGAVSFQRAGFERFYFVDRTQRILHQPD